MSLCAGLLYMLLLVATATAAYEPLLCLLPVARLCIVLTISVFRPTSSTLQLVLGPLPLADLYLGCQLDADVLLLYHYTFCLNSSGWTLHLQVGFRVATFHTGRVRSRSETQQSSECLFSSDDHPRHVSPATLSCAQHAHQQGYA